MLAHNKSLSNGFGSGANLFDRIEDGKDRFGLESGHGIESGNVFKLPRYIFPLRSFGVNVGTSHRLCPQHSHIYNEVISVMNGKAIIWLNLQMNGRHTD